MSYPIDPLEQLSDQELESLAAYEHPITDRSIQGIQGCFTARIAEGAEAGGTAGVPEITEGAGIAQATKAARITEVVPAPAQDAVAGVAGTAQRRPLKRYLVAAALAAAFVVLVGFTNGSRVYALYYQHFGEGAHIAQYVSEIGQSAHDQGFRMEVLSAVNDGDNTYLFVDVTDEAGGRLSEDAVVNRWNMTGSRPLGGGGTSLVGYDPATETATFAVHSISAKPGDSVLFTLSSFMSGATDYSVLADTIDIAQLLAQQEGSFVTRNAREGTSGGLSPKFHDEGRDLSEIKEVLELDALALAIPGFDKAWISNIAYRDGMLHVQLGRDRDRGNVAVWLGLVQRDTGERLDPYYTIGVGQRNEDGLADHEECVFEVDRDALTDYSFVVEGFYYTQVFDGTWEVGFRVPERMDSLVRQVGADIGIGGKTAVVAEVELSPLGLTLRMQDTYQFKGELNIVAAYRDGSSVTINEGEVNTLFHGEDTFTFIRAILDFESIKHLDINGAIIAL
ncbi:MAG: DUF4179 domain-containing protein [Eggerthellaceae bacterium]|nr:DUF4179 domain-containing protein [Eggerthellaceae bacterium]